MPYVVNEVVEVWAEVESLQPLLRARRWAALEATAQRECAALAGWACAQVIADVDTRDYEAELGRCARQLAADCPADAQAVAFEFDPENRWESTFFLCSDPHPPLRLEGEWACDWLHHVSGPDFEPFAELYEELGGFGRSARAVGATFYLITRTVAAAGRAMVQVDFGARALCVVYHDGQDVLRVHEL
jgi:hypothetical protein